MGPPDVFCNGKSGDDVADIKTKLQEAAKFIGERLPPGTTLQRLVAEDIDEFCDFPLELGWYGHRMRES